MKAPAIAILAGLTMAAAPPASPQGTATETAFAVFAGGCFWCMEPPYDKLDGVLSTVSGYIGGTAEDADYQRVASGRTGHFEAIRIEYDPQRIDYATLLEVFWRNVDPFDGRGQFCDRGPQYLTAIFALDEKQRKLAEAREGGRGFADLAARRDPDRDPAWHGVLPGGRVPPGLLHEKSRALQAVPLELRPRPAAAGHLGRVVAMPAGPRHRRLTVRKGSPSESVLGS